MQNPLQFARIRFLVAAGWLACLNCGAETTNTASTLLIRNSLPETGPSVLRVIGALALVLGLFLGGVWFVRNGRQLAFRRGRPARLNVLESRSLGTRQALFVVGYDEERFLIASTPTGINLVSHLPSAIKDQSLEVIPAVAPVPFAQALAQVLKGGNAITKT